MRRSLAAALLISALAIGAGFIPHRAAAIDFQQRSISSSQQFVVYCPDIRLRMAVNGYVETVKSSVLEAINQGDHWKYPIVINIQKVAATDPFHKLCEVNFIENEVGAKVEINVALDVQKFAEVRFPQQVVRAVLIEIANRKQLPKPGEPYLQPPAWLVEGIAQRMQERATDTAPNADLFKQLIDTGKLPHITEFLASNVDAMDSTSRTVYAACCESLLQMIAELPGGRQSLGTLIMNLASAQDTPAAQLLKYFPALGGNEAALEKWWTLGLARYSVSQRYLGMSVKDTEARLTPFLTFQIVTDPKKGTKSNFNLSEYSKFAKLPGARAVLYAQANAIATLGAQAHPLMRPVISEYQHVFLALAEGKTQKIDESLRDLENYRSMIVDRMEKIADYLNWFEATQMPELSGAFDNYLKAASAIEKTPPPHRDDAISRYVDQVAQEFDD